MSTLPQESGYRREHNCQTPACPNDFSTITIDVDSADVMMLCHVCTMAFWTAALQQAAERGLIGGGDQAAAATG